MCEAVVATEAKVSAEYIGDAGLAFSRANSILGGERVIDHQNIDDCNYVREIHTALDFHGDNFKMYHTQPPGTTATGTTINRLKVRLKDFMSRRGIETDSELLGLD